MHDVPVTCSFASFTLLVRNQLPLPSQDGVEIPSLALDYAFNIGRDPAAVEISRLRLDLFAIHETGPWIGVEGDVAADGLKRRRRTLIRPGSIGYRGAVWQVDLVVRRRAFEFAHGLSPGWSQGYAD